WRSGFSTQIVTAAFSGTGTKTLPLTQQDSGTITANLSLVAADIPDLSAVSQAINSDLTDILSLTPTDDDIIQRKSGAWTNRTMSQLKTDLSLSASDVGLGNVENTA